MDYNIPGFLVLHDLLELAQTHVHWVGDVIQLSHPLLPPAPHAFDLSQHQGLFQWVNSLNQVAKVLEFQLKLQSFHEYSRLISFRMDLLDVLIVQGTLKSLLQHHSSEAPVFQHPAFLMVQLSHPYMTTGKIIALIMWNFVGKLMSLFFWVQTCMVFNKWHKHHDNENFANFWKPHHFKVENNFRNVFNREKCVYHYRLSTYLGTFVSEDFEKVFLFVFLLFDWLF